MITDQIVKEMREIRHGIEQECQQDPEKYFQRLKASQETMVERLVCRRPKPLVTVEQRKTR